MFGLNYQIEGFEYTYQLFENDHKIKPRFLNYLLPRILVKIAPNKSKEGNKPVTKSCSSTGS